MEDVKRTPDSYIMQAELEDNIAQTENKVGHVCRKLVTSRKCF